jgi:hypothetical protein
MKRAVFAAVLIAAALPAYSLTFLEYLAHINFSLGPAVVAGANVSGTSDIYLFTITSTGGGGSQTFLYWPGDLDQWPVALGASLRIPLYFNTAFSLGLTGDIAYAGSLTTGVWGLYFEQYFREGLSFLGGLGVSGAILSEDLGTVKAGFGSHSGKTLTLAGNSFSGPGFMLAAKYHLFKYCFLEAGYRFGWKQKIDDYELQIDSKELDYSGATLAPLNVSPSHSFAVKIGFGI